MNQKILQRIFPFLDWIPKVNKGTLRSDFIAGITGAVIVLPQGVAFALIAGMPPIYGLYTAMIAPIITALYGSSNHMITGPATAISIVIFSSISPLAEPGTESFVALALVLTVLVGMIQLVMGFARLGTLVNFVSHTVVMGFTAGAAILIAVSQLKHVMGIKIATGSSIIETFSALYTGLDEFNLYIFITALVTLITAILLKWINKRIPYMLIAMLIGGLVSFLLGGESKGIPLVGEMPSGLPPFRMPDLNYQNIRQLSSSAFALALLGLIEAVAIARSIAVHSGQRINGNKEFIGQGLANFIGGFFSCFAGSGSFTRSGVNFQAGAKTPMASIFAAVLLVIILIFVAPLTAYLPMPAMGGLIILVAYNLIDFQHIKEVLKISNRESTVLILTFLATLFLELEFAIYIGVIFSLVFYLRDSSKPRVVDLVLQPNVDYVKLVNHKKYKAASNPSGMKILRVDGSLFFGAVENVSNLLDDELEGFEGHLLLDLSGVSLIDMSGAEMLITIAGQYQNRGITLHLCNLKKSVRRYMKKGNYRKLLKGVSVHKDEIQALKHILSEMNARNFTPEDKDLLERYRTLIGSVS